MGRFKFSKKDNEFYKEFIKKEDEAIKKQKSSEFVSGAKLNFTGAFVPVMESKSGTLDPRPIDPRNRVFVRDFNQDFKLKQSKHSELDAIGELFSGEADLRSPEKTKDKLFIEGNFKKHRSFRDTVMSSNVTKGSSFFAEGLVQEKKENIEHAVKEVADAIIKKSKSKKKLRMPRLGKRLKNWYETYLKKEKPAPKPKPEVKEESWISEKDANRMRILAGLPAKYKKEPVVEIIVKRTRWERFRIFSFRQLSLLIWRIHPDAKVETTVVKPRNFNFKSTPDVEFLMKAS